MNCPLLRPMVLVTVLAAASPAGAAEVIACDGRSTGFGSAELVCPIAPAAAPDRLRLHVRFAGVHDDSTAGLAASLDGAAVACGEGSTARIAGDAGGDALLCRIAVDTSHQGARKLVVNLLWYHAEPVEYQLTREATAP